MLYRIFIILFSLLLFCGCATTKSEQIGGFRNILYSDLSFYSQYEILYNSKQGEKDIQITKPFLASGNLYIPDSTIKLHLGLMVRNPNRENFDIWVESRFTELDTDNIFQRTKSIVYGTQRLPEEFISISIPINYVNSQIDFWVTVVSKTGDVLYESSKAIYKIGKSKK
jgi:hypothetical protein